MTPPRPVVIEQAAAKERPGDIPHLGDGYMPGRWFTDPPHYRCQNGHVGQRYRLDRNDKTRALCWKCLGFIWITFPEDTETKPARKRPAK